MVRKIKLIRARGLMDGHDIIDLSDDPIKHITIINHESTEMLVLSSQRCKAHNCRNVKVEWLTDQAMIPRRVDFDKQYSISVIIVVEPRFNELTKDQLELPLR